MNLVADENVDLAIVSALRSDGYEVWYVADRTSGVTDEEVIAASVEKRALLLTCDKDFGDLIFRQKQETSGVLLLRLGGLTPEHKARIVISALREHGEDLAGRFSVLTKRTLRIRGVVDPG